MPRFFDDYSYTYLTHDSSAGRKQQRRGWKFRENFQLHYEKKLDEWRSGPMGLAAAQQAFIRSRGANDPAVPPLPEGWKEEVDDATRITFYIHDKTGERTWVRPNFFPPPPGPPSRGPGGYPSRPPPFGGRGPPPGNFGGRGPPPPPHMSGPPPPMSGPPPPFATRPPPPQFGAPPPPHPGAPQFPPPGAGPPPPPHGSFPPPSLPPPQPGGPPPYPPR